MIRNTTIPVEVIIDRIEYREEIIDGILQGNLYWKFCMNMPESWNNRLAGKKVGSVGSRGYLKFNLKHNNKKIFMNNHTAVYIIHENMYPVSCIDHIDGNKTNNLFANLRSATPYLNNLNRNPNDKETSQYKGISYNKNRKKWEVRVRNTEKTKYNTKFHKYVPDEIEAALLYNQEVVKYHDPEFVVLNDISNGYTNKEYPNKPRGWKPE